MLVPAATSIGIRCSSNQRITPTWAMPFALPPPNATPIFWRSCAEAPTAEAMSSRTARTRPGQRRTMEFPQT